MPKGMHCAFFSILLLDSIVKVVQKYYPQTFLEESKYAVRKIKTTFMKN